MLLDLARASVGFQSILPMKNPLLHKIAMPMHHGTASRDKKYYDNSKSQFNRKSAPDDLR
jgi:ribosomal protein L5